MKKLLLFLLIFTAITIGEEGEDKIKINQFKDLDKKILTHFKVVDNQRDAKLLYRRGLNQEKGLERNYKKAVEYYKEAAELGLAKAQTRLATMYYLGKGVKPDNKKATEWYLKASKQNDLEAKSNLCVIYSLSSTDKRANKTKAYKCWKEASKQGHKSANLKLQFFCIEHGWACKQ